MAAADRIDADLLQAVLTRWLRARAAPVVAAGRRWRLVIAIDGKVQRGARLPDGRQVHLVSAYDTTAGIVLAQVQIAAKSDEIPAFAPLVDRVAAQLGSLQGVLFVADALSRYRDNASYAEVVVMPRWSVATVVEAVTTAVRSA